MRGGSEGLDIVAFATIVGSIMIGGLCAYRFLGISADDVIDCFRVALFGSILINAYLQNTHTELQESARLALSITEFSGLLGWIVDGIIFKFWKPTRAQDV